MFVFRYFEEADALSNTYNGWEVGFFCWERDLSTKEMTQKFQRIASFVLRMEAAEYCHWLNGGTSYKYDNFRTED